MAISINGSTGISGVDGSAATPSLQGSDANTGVFFGTDEVKISTGGTEAITVDASQRVGIGTTSPAVACDVIGEVRASTGILFGSDTAAANTLDDYEEGTWAPTIGVGTLAYSYGYYTRIGRLVIAAFSLGFPSSSSSTRVQVQSLPFVNFNPGPANLPNFGSANGYTNSNRVPGIHLIDNTTTFDVYNNDGLDLTYAQFSGKDYRGVAIYFTV